MQIIGFKRVGTLYEHPTLKTYGIINYLFVIIITGRPWRSGSQKLCSITVHSLGLGAHTIFVPGPVNFSDGSDTDRHRKVIFVLFLFLSPKITDPYIFYHLCGRARETVKKKSRIKRKYRCISIN